jgi:hypothetical protein
MTTHAIEYEARNGKKTGSRSNREDWWHGCWRSDQLDRVGWAAIFIWAALVVAADSTSFHSNFGWWDAWGVFFTGAGVIVLAETVLRFLMPDYRARWSWTLIVGSVLLAIGLGTWESLEWVWALVLAAIGVAILRNAILRRRGSDRGGPDVRE